MLAYRISKMDYGTELPAYIDTVNSDTLLIVTV